MRGAAAPSPAASGGKGPEGQRTSQEAAQARKRDRLVPFLDRVPGAAVCRRTPQLGAGFLTLGAAAGDKRPRRPDRMTSRTSHASRLRQRPRLGSSGALIAATLVITLFPPLQEDLRQRLEANS